VDAPTRTIERARRGDRAARAALLRQLQDPWYRLCRSLLGDADLAREATQETALRFLRDLPRFRGQSTLNTWSMGIAINVVREMRRAQGAPETQDRRRLAVPRRGALSPDELAQQAESDERLRATLNDLSERQREAIVLRYFEDQSIDETALAMNCAPGTVKATVHQALRILRGRLRQLI
jgi:RNA polymerase sigma-70 factor (ECF subfamily)